MGEHVPKFLSREEEIRFWDTHDLETLSPDELEEIKVQRPERPPTSTFAIRLDQRTIEVIRYIAKARGLGPTQLVRSWVLERLSLERKAGRLADTTTEFPQELERSMRDDIVRALLASAPEAVECALQSALERVDQESSFVEYLDTDSEVAEG
jgi:hypothetical protein